MFGPLPQLIFHATLVATLSIYSILGDQDFERPALALAFIPLLRILGLTLALPELSLFDQNVIVGILLLIGIAFAARHMGLSRNELGLQLHAWQGQGLIVFVGIPLSVVAYLLYPPQSVMAIADATLWTIGVISLSILAGLIEELLFRGFLQRIVAPRIGSAAIVYSGVLGASLYFGSLSISFILFITFTGIFLGWCVNRTESIWGAVCTRSIIGVGHVLIWPYIQVSIIQVGSITSILLWLALACMMTVAVVLQLKVRPVQFAHLSKPQHTEQNNLLTAGQTEGNVDNLGVLYRRLTQDDVPPLLSIHVEIEQPFEVSAVLFVSSRHIGKQQQQQNGKLLLLSNNILLESDVSYFLPRHFHYVSGIIQCRHFSTESSIITLKRTPEFIILRRKISEAIKNQLLVLLEQQPTQFQLFWKEFGSYFDHVPTASYDYRTYAVRDRRSDGEAK